MPCICGFVCGSPPRKKISRETKMDFRKADPNYVKFTPATCMEAIDLFNRHRRLGLTADLYPECFVHCARALPDEELDMFHRFIINPDGDITKGGEKLTGVDRELEAERRQLVEEAERRDLPAIEEDEKTPDSDMLEALRNIKEPSVESPTESKSDDTEDSYLNVLTSPS